MGGKSFLGRGCLDSPHHTNEDSMVTQSNQKCIPVVVLLAFKAFSLELNCLERFMINKGRNLYSKKKDRVMHGHKEMSR
jgi:hypothetical protein